MPPSSSALLGSLPIPRARLVGRETEVATGLASLLAEAVPLLTLTGPGGAGKTRLALALAADVAARFADGVVWVDLTPVADPPLVAATVAAALELHPAADRPVADELIRHLRLRQTLLLLDNCEHVLAAVGDLVSDLLAACPALQVLATSRAPLHIRGEQALAIPTLAVPVPGVTHLERVGKSPAVQLFVQRAPAAEARFALDEQNAAAVAEICQRLDGLPLAVELAAARANLLSPAALLSLLRQQLPVLGTAPRDAPPRHQTIRDAIAWSYALLSTEEQVWFRALSGFAGGWTLEAAAAIWGYSVPDALARLDTLVDQSLVARQTDGAAESQRFTMLETIREFGRELLEAHGEAAAVLEAHAAWCAGLLAPPEALMVLYLPDALSRLDRLRQEYPNLRGDGLAAQQRRRRGCRADRGGALRGLARRGTARGRPDVARVGTGSARPPRRRSRGRHAGPGRRLLRPG